MATDTIVLEFRGQIVHVRGVVSIGRSPTCHVAIADDVKISRMHAKLVTDESGTTLVDLDSSNGVFLNGVRLTDPTRVKPGDIIRVGDQSLALMSPHEAKHRCSETHPELPPTLTLSMRGSSSAAEPNTEPYGIDRYQARWLQIEDAISRRDWSHAEDLLENQLGRVTRDVEATGTLPPATQEEASRHAIDMALASRKATWMEALIALHMAARLPLPSAAAVNLPQILRKLPDFDLELLRSYVDALREARALLTPVERQLCSSIESALLALSSEK